MVDMGKCLEAPGPIVSWGCIAGWGSFHPGVLVFAACNGSVHAISESIDMELFCQPTAAGTKRVNAGPGSSGQTDIEGRFVLKTATTGRNGAVPGKHVVRITTVPQQQGIPVEESRGPGETVLPKQCGDGTLRFEVPPEGAECANFDITL